MGYRTAQTAVGERLSEWPRYLSRRRYIDTMTLSTRTRFAVTALFALGLVAPLTALLTPPDPFTQLLAAGVLSVAATALAYMLSYGGGYRILSSLVNR